MALSDTWLRANNGKNQKKGFVRTDRDGLSIRVSPRGKIVFQMRYRFNGKQDRVSLGSYPFMSLKDARAETVRLRTKLEEGNCPKLVKQLAKQEIVGAVSIKELFMQWYKAYCIKNKKGHKEILRSFELYIFPKIGNLPAEKITIREWLNVLEEVANSVPGTAHRILTNAKQMLKWSVNRRLITENLLRDISASEDLSIEDNVGDRFFDDEEIRLVWKAVTESKMAHKNKLFVKLCLVFGCRNGELRLSQIEHFDFNRKVWTVPKENHKLGKKTKKPLLRPIIPEVELLVKEAIQLSDSDTYVFTNSGSHHVMGRSAPLALPYNIMQWLRKNLNIEMKHWSIHDLRKTMRTNMSELTEPHIAEIMLGHKLPGNWEVYDHHKYLKEQAAAYSKWWKKIVLVTGTRGTD